MNIQYYIIHCYEHKEREPHIKSIWKKLKQSLCIMKGVYTQNIPLNKQYAYIRSFNPHIKTTPFSFWGSGQIGCYLSHFQCIHSIMNKPGYSVIFEDDVIIQTNLHESVKQIISKAPDFDIIFLGNLSNNHGTKIVDNIYSMNKNSPCWGTHAMLINNKHIQKIYNEVSVIKSEIDNQYTEAVKMNRLNGYVIYPSICNQSLAFKSSTKPSVHKRKPSMKMIMHNPNI